MVGIGVAELQFCLAGTREPCPAGGVTTGSQGRGCSASSLMSVSAATGLKTTADLAQVRDPKPQNVLEAVWVGVASM